VLSFAKALAGSCARISAKSQTFFFRENIDMQTRSLADGTM
jgi:hypothetical protein